MGMFRHYTLEFKLVITCISLVLDVIPSAGWKLVTQLMSPLQQSSRTKCDMFVVTVRETGETVWAAHHTVACAEPM